MQLAREGYKSSQRNNKHSKFLKKEAFETRSYEVLALFTHSQTNTTGNVGRSDGLGGNSPEDEWPLEQQGRST